ncbi:MAG: hypothetical protein PUJ92_00040 [Bacilli bacterium]|nr:hypothetical protein [Bacilli bacterium]MDY5832852.1 hypothetical protein [Candidatus Onthovivens sp.]
MTLEEVKQKLKVFDKYTFEEDTHTYYCKGKRVGISVTRLIEEYSNPFDQQGIAEKVALRDNKDVTQVLQEWEYKNKFACEKGHFAHEFAQSLWSGIIYQENIKSGLEDIKTPLNKIKQQAINFYNDFKDKFIHIQDEQLVGSEEYDIASAVDHLFLDNEGNVWLIDYKTNSILRGYNDNGKNKKYTKKMLVPLQNIKDDALHHYYLQLSIYKYLIEKYTNIKIHRMLIVYMSENVENYELIKIPYLEEKVKLILENRRERKMGKCIPVLIIGKSGSGKSTSLRNLNKEDYSLVNPLAKRLPFKGGQTGLESCDYELIKKFIQETPKKIIVIDDSNYLLTMEMMKKAKETGYGKFTDIALNYWKLIEFIKNLDGDKRVYLMSHEEIDEFGNIGVKTVGKMLSNQCCVEGLYTIVLRATNENGKFQFRTKTAGNDIVKTPIGLFEEELIDNDLKIVDNAICEYYEINKEEKKDEEEK